MMVIKTGLSIGIDDKATTSTLALKNYYKLLKNKISQWANLLLKLKT